MCDSCLNPQSRKTDLFITRCQFLRIKKILFRKVGFFFLNDNYAINFVRDLLNYK